MALDEALRPPTASRCTGCASGPLDKASTSHLARGGSPPPPPAAAARARRASRVLNSKYSAADRVRFTGRSNPAPAPPPPSLTPAAAAAGSAGGSPGGGGAAGAAGGASRRVRGI